LGSLEYNMRRQAGLNAQYFYFISSFRVQLSFFAIIMYMCNNKMLIYNLWIIVYPYQVVNAFI
ncbi:MAG: hypothetical protein ACJ704_12595, partial [Nitrososphaeraceae archaeon]